MSGDSLISLNLQQQQDYRCLVEFGGDVPALFADEPAPLGSGQGPSPVQLLLSAVANCLTNSLVFAARKFHQSLEPLSCQATAQVGRNAENRLRVLAIEATLTLGQPVDGVQHLDRILGQFEDFCTVTRSVAQGIPVRVSVRGVDGVLLKQPVAD